MRQTDVVRTPPPTPAPLAGTKPGPEKRFPAKGGICAAVWRKTGVNAQGKPTEWRTISFERRYKDKTNEWRSSKYLLTDELPKARLVLEQAYEYLVTKT